MALALLELKALNAADHGRRLTDGGSLKGKVHVARDGAVSVQFRFAYKFGGKFREVLVGKLAGTLPYLVSQYQEIRNGDYDPERTQLLVRNALQWLLQSPAGATK